MKKLLCLLFVFTLMVFQPFHTVMTPTQPVSEDFINSLSIIYENPDAQCTLKDRNGVNITDDFVSATIGYYKTDNREAIRSYYIQNVKSMSIITEKAVRSLNGDIGRQVSEIQGGYANGISGISSTQQSLPGWEDQAIEYLYELVGTFYYDPNTYKISTASNSSIRNMTVNPGGYVYGTANESTPRGTISSDKYSVTFSHACNIYFQFAGATTYFERINHSFTATSYEE